MYQGARYKPLPAVAQVRWACSARRHPAVGCCGIRDVAALFTGCPAAVVTGGAGAGGAAGDGPGPGRARCSSGPHGCRLPAGGQPANPTPFLPHSAVCFTLAMLPQQRARVNLQAGPVRRCLPPCRGLACCISREPGQGCRRRGVKLLGSLQELLQQA